jgi:hypothetical protein
MYRLQKKIAKGKDRLKQVLYEECQTVDNMMGCHGYITLPVFQNIMFDYDLIVLEQDRLNLKDRGYMILDKEKNEYVDYQKMFEEHKPKA